MKSITIVSKRPLLYLGLLITLSAMTIPTPAQASRVISSCRSYTGCGVVVQKYYVTAVPVRHYHPPKRHRVHRTKVVYPVVYRAPCDAFVDSCARPVVYRTVNYDCGSYCGGGYGYGDGYYYTDDVYVEPDTFYRWY